MLSIDVRLALALVLALLAPSASAETARGFIDAATTVEDLAVDMRYFGTDNFVGARIDGYEAARCLLTRQAASALAAVQRDLAPRGVGLKVFDCYRPTRAVAHFVRWARDVRDIKRKAEFYPDVDKRNLFALGYIAGYSGHSRGSTVDITLFGARTAASSTWARRSISSARDRGRPTRSVGAEARQNRALLADAMRRGGFRPYDKEWWHFTLRGEPFPGSYFDFPVR